MPRQKLGQHFLNDASILDRIARAACPQRQDTIIEVGPGRGSLTQKLLERAERVVAVELDYSLVEHLRERFRGEPRLEIVAGDILKTDLTPHGGAPIVGNLPYYITSPILRHVAQYGPRRAVFLIQKEVAQRLAAARGCRDYGYLTIQTAVFWEARVLFDVKPGAFRPPPQVDSAVALLEPRTRALPASDTEGFLRFAGLCFEHKRKTITNNLAGTYGRERIAAWPEAQLRAEQLSLEQLLEMYRRLG